MTTRVYANYKRIVLCADGTWTASDTGNKNVPSNVARIARAIANNGTEGFDVHGPLVKQIVFYSAGIGATDLWLQKGLYGAFGWGLDVEVCQMYDFISNNYQPGDELFFFGFSRGAYTVRSVANLVAEAGILDAVNMNKFANMWDAYRNRSAEQPFKKSGWYEVNQGSLGLGGVEVKAVGVWDTVGSLGLPEYSWVKFLGLSKLNEKYKFHDLNLSNSGSLRALALAMDERRERFSPTVWQPTNSMPTDRLQQCWFPGTHGNIGGPSEYAQAFENIGDITFGWMVDNMSGMLTFEKAAIDEIVDQHRQGSHACSEHGAWGCETVTSNFEGLVGKFWQTLGIQNRTPGSYGATANEFIHPIARLRQNHAKMGSHPLTNFAAEWRKDARGWEWRNGSTLSIVEEVLRKKRMVSVAFGGPSGNVATYQIEESLSRRLCPEGPNGILSGLDRDNGI